MKQSRQDVLVIGSGVVSPWSAGVDALARGLYDGRIATTRREFPGAGNLSVGACDFIGGVRGEDRSVTLLRTALEPLLPMLQRMNAHVPCERRGVCVGVSKPGLMLYLENPDSAADRFPAILPDFVARHAASIIDARGPLQGLSAACATSLQNVIRAAEWIAYGDADYAIAGASDAALTDLYLSSLVQLGAMTREECRPFDARHAGFTAGEGAGVVVLATADAAERIGAKPLARISGWAFGAEAFHATACDRTGLSTARVLRKTLADANVTAEGIDLLGVHATGTPLSDLADANALRILYGDHAQPPVLSIKGAIGHLMGACGSAEIAATLCCLYDQKIPVVPGFEKAAAGCEFLSIPRETKAGRVDRVLKWNAGFGGQIAACVIERVLTE